MTRILTSRLANPILLLNYLIIQTIFYCQSLNKGIEMSRGDFILCLNDDVILDKRFIEEALKGFNFGGKIGMVKPWIVQGYFLSQT